MKSWFSRKYYASVMNLRDFLSDNIAHEFVGVVAQALISSITSLITSFRSETHEEAITPEVLGALLQKIADLLGKAALQTDMSRLDNWRSDLARIGYVLTSLTIGSDDRNNVYFTLGKANLSLESIKLQTIPFSSAKPLPSVPVSCVRSRCRT